MSKMLMIDHPEDVELFELPDIQERYDGLYMCFSGYETEEDSIIFDELVDNLRNQYSEKNITVKGDWRPSVSRILFLK